MVNTARNRGTEIQSRRCTVGTIVWEDQSSLGKKNNNKNQPFSRVLKSKQNLDKEDRVKNETVSASASQGLGSGSPEGRAASPPQLGQQCGRCPRQTSLEPHLTFSAAADVGTAEKPEARSPNPNVF